MFQLVALSALLLLAVSAGERYRNCEINVSASTASQPYEVATCRFYAGQAAVVLVGAANASEQSPVRRQMFLDGASTTRRVSTLPQLDFSGLWSALDWNSVLVSGAVLPRFLWDPATIRTFFLRREMIIEFEFSIDSGERQTYGPTAAATHKASELVKLVAFPPMRQRGDGLLVCDPEVLADGHGIANICAAHAHGSMLPQGLREMLGLTPATAHVTLTAKPTPSSPNGFLFSCYVSMGIPTTTCIRIAAPQTTAEAPITATITTRTAPDRSTALLFAALVVLALWQSLLERSRVAQLFCAGFFGVVFLAVLAVVYVVRDLSNTRMGKVGISVVALGGIAALAEGFFSAVAAYVVVEAQQNIIVQSVLLVTYIASAVAAHFLFGGGLLRATVLVVQALRLGILAALLMYNPEACIVGATGLVTALLAGRFALAIGTRIGGLLFSSRNDPQENLPPQASVAVEYAKPVAAGLHGTREQKMLQYQRDGEKQTRLALEQLAATIRANPAKYAAKVKNPNQLVRWAGESE
jgi:hypothetical protein